MLDLSPGTLIGGKYRLDRLLARGGMGAIWVGRDERLRRVVAIKFMDPELAVSQEARARFEREAQAAAQLPSKHVVQIFDHGIDDGTPFIAMELLEGEDLGKRLKRQRRLSLREAAKIAKQVGKALRRAHEAGIVHRDLKPQNVFLARTDDEEIVKVLDFGVAKARHDDGEATRTGSVLGSPLYMSPEQARGLKSVDHRSDLWSLGVILYRTLTGKTPFTGEAAGDLIVKICSDPFPLPSSVSSDLPVEVDAFFARALARSPDERFQNVGEMVDAFAAVAGMGRDESLGPSVSSHDDPPSTSQPSLMERLNVAAATPPLVTLTPTRAEPSRRSRSDSAGTLSSASSASSASDRVERRGPHPVVLALIGAGAIAAAGVGAFLALRSTTSQAQGADGTRAVVSSTLTAPLPKPSVEPAPSADGPTVSPAPPASAASPTSTSARPSTASAPSTAGAPQGLAAGAGPKPVKASAPPHETQKNRPTWGY